MSGPKCGEYRVVSEAELRARRLAAAKGRFERLRASRSLLAGRAEAAARTYGRLDLSASQIDAPRVDDAEAWEAACEDLEREVRRFDEQLGEAISSCRSAAVFQSAKGLTAVLADPPVGDTPRVARSIADDTAEEVARIVGRLPADAADEVVVHAGRLAHDCVSTPPGALRDRTLIQLRTIVQGETDRAKRIRRTQLEIDSLRARLDGLEHLAGIRSLQDKLDDASASHRIPDDLHHQVELAVAEAEAEADRAFVLAAAQASLVSLGYEPGEEFSTAVVTEGALLELPGRRSHGLQIREHAQQLFFNVVKFEDSPSHEDDAAAEVAFCADFQRLRVDLLSGGVEVRLLRADQPGETAMQRTRRRPVQTGRRRTRSEAPRERHMK